MKTPNSKSTKKQKASARNHIECYHQGNDLEDKVIRKEIYFHITCLCVTSPWWLAINAEKRADIIDHLITHNEKDDELDVMFN